MTCAKCGVELSPGARFCGSCGERRATKTLRNFLIVVAAVLVVGELANGIDAFVNRPSSAPAADHVIGYTLSEKEDKILTLQVNGDHDYKDAEAKRQFKKSLVDMLAGKIPPTDEAAGFALYSITLARTLPAGSPCFARLAPPDVLKGNDPCFDGDWKKAEESATFGSNMLALGYELDKRGIPVAGIAQKDAKLFSGMTH
jgi:hypothetical protein